MTTDRLISQRSNCRFSRCDAVTAASAIARTCFDRAIMFRACSRLRLLCSRMLCEEVIARRDPPRILSTVQAYLILRAQSGALKLAEVKESRGTWRKRVRVEHTHDTAKMPRAGFEDREDHRIPCASAPRSIESERPWLRKGLGPLSSTH